DVESITSSKCRPVPDPDDDKVKGADPHRCRVEGVADVLLRSTKNRARIVSLSLKDRSSILLAALRLLGSICYWFSLSLGGFVTSTNSNDTLHPFVRDFNRSQFADQWFDKSWDRLHGDLDYVKHAGPDDVFAEGIGYDQGRTFPHPFHKAGAKL